MKASERFLKSRGTPWRREASARGAGDARRAAPRPNPAPEAWAAPAPERCERKKENTSRPALKLPVSVAFHQRPAGRWGVLELLPLGGWHDPDNSLWSQLPYGGAPGGPAFPGQTQDPLYGYFAAVAGQDGQIDADELQRCLTQSGIAGGYKPFNLETCRLMVSMLDRDMSGTMGFNEFKELWAVLNGWRQHFISFDSDRSGTVDPQELQKALTTMGFRLSPQAVNSIAKRYSTNGKITFDDYIACCVKLRALTDSFRRRDTAQQGVVNFPYDDFIQCVMSV